MTSATLSLPGPSLVAGERGEALTSGVGADIVRVRRKGGAWR